MRSESFLNTHASPHRSNENKSCMTVDENVDESWEARVFSTLMPRRIGQTRTRVAWQLMRMLMRVEKREFSQHSCLAASVKREQELHDSWWELTGYYRARSENSHQLSWKFEPVQSWWECMIESRWELAIKRERELQLLINSHPRLIETLSPWLAVLNAFPTLSCILLSENIVGTLINPLFCYSSFTWYAFTPRKNIDSNS